ncbi:hypothetical protein A9995_04355 [Erythrobacter sp. QSSC1-22B]|uniref:DUF4331 domain-containing protein n=1 Tax=Erythrobacter sp. QSSC1-22B TaxID=1860125 RepID=UPI000804C3D6|nr:DUF4331 domain-containing protein [Erythrobacter sp. QSSC1-22B]OBX19798.1 hypothetical protein A9995_04355 [Erythrobacter sp. QSSC1-22B]
MISKNKLALGAAALALCVVSGTASASSHREAPDITETPKIDNTDFYMFRSYETGREGFVTIIANYQPIQFPGGGPNYFTMDPDAKYEIHIDSNGDAKEDLTFSFQFTNSLRNGGIALNIGGKNVTVPLRYVGPVTGADDADLNETETYQVTAVKGDRRSGSRSSITHNGGATFVKPLDNVGNKTLPNYDGYANSLIYPVNIPGCAAGGRVFVGQREEAFAVNLGETFDLVNYVPIEGDSAAFAGDGGGFPGGITQSRANDSLVGEYNVTSIAMEVPIACLTAGGNGVIGGWATSSLPQARINDPSPTYQKPTFDGGAFVQMSRLGMPLVNELVIGLDKKDVFNHAEPTQDGALADFVTNPTFPALLNALFRAPVNATLGTDIADLAPSNFPRQDLVATFLTGIKTLNQQTTVTPSEMTRLNTAIAPTPRATQSRFGVVGDDLAGFPNGRRPGDDVVDIVLRVAMGRLCHPVPINGQATDLGLCKPADAPVGQVAFTDGAPISARDLQGQFPYLNSPIPGSPNSARDARAVRPAQP